MDSVSFQPKRFFIVYCCKNISAAKFPDAIQLLIIAEQLKFSVYNVSISNGANIYKSTRVRTFDFSQHSSGFDI